MSTIGASTGAICRQAWAVRVTCVAALSALAASNAAAQVTADVAIAPSDEAATCLAAAIYYEAGFEPREGRQAVAEVVLNRLADRRFPKSVCGVVYQGASRRTGCQFTFTCDGSLARPPQPAAWAEAVEIARTALAAVPEGLAGGANHYHADYVRPGWARTMRETMRIGRHIFYSDRAGPDRSPPAPAPSGGAAPEPFAPWGLSLRALGTGS